MRLFKALRIISCLYAKKASRRRLLPQTQNRNWKLYLAFHQRTCYSVRYLLYFSCNTNCICCIQATSQYIYYAYVIDAFVQFLDISYNTLYTHRCESLHHRGAEESDQGFWRSGYDNKREVRRSSEGIHRSQDM